MPRYHFQQKTGDVIVNDDEGSDFLSVETARHYALRGARELLAESIKCNGSPPPDCIVVVDGQGREVATVLITEALPDTLRSRIR
jgi:hypothetical protein